MEVFARQREQASSSSEHVFEECCAIVLREGLRISVAVLLPDGPLKHQRAAVDVLAEFKAGDIGLTGKQRLDLKAQPAGGGPVPTSQNARISPWAW